MKKLNVIAVIPAYNESDTIHEIVMQSRRYTSRIIVIDDGSTDNTANVCHALDVIVIRNSRRMGKGIALKRGLIEAMKYDIDIVVVLDADGQHDPSDIPKLTAPIEQLEADIVIGSRYSEKVIQEFPLMRKFGLSIINRFNSYLIKTRIKDSQSGFRAYGKSVVEKVVSYTSTGYGVETEQLALADLYGYRIVEVPVNIRYKGLRHTSKTNSIIHGMIIIFTIIRLAVEKKPLLIFGLSGLILLLGSIYTATHLMALFNDSRYFSIPLALITLGLVFIGSLFILVAVILYVLRKIREI